MKTLCLLIVGGICMSSGSALAWDDPKGWYGSVTDPNLPGGGGILGTGGAHDHKITCRDCHTDRVDNPNLKLDMQFSPALPIVNGEATYAPGQRYQVAVNLRGAYLGPPCEQYMVHTDNFAAGFENDSGDTVGSLETDSGQSATNCPTTAPMAETAGTTGLYGDCKVIFAKGKAGIDAWSFFWTAPTSGAVRIYYGGVDGDCDMMSMEDGVVVGTTSLKAPQLAQVTPPSHQKTHRRPPWSNTIVFSMVLLGVVVAPLTRRRRRS